MIIIIFISAMSSYVLCAATLFRGLTADTDGHQTSNLESHSSSSRKNYIPPHLKFHHHHNHNHNHIHIMGGAGSKQKAAAAATRKAAAIAEARRVRVPDMPPPRSVTAMGHRIEESSDSGSAEDIRRHQASTELDPSLLSFLNDVGPLQTREVSELSSSVRKSRKSRYISSDDDDDEEDDVAVRESSGRKIRDEDGFKLKEHEIFRLMVQIAEQHGEVDIDKETEVALEEISKDLQSPRIKVNRRLTLKDVEEGV